VQIASRWGPGSSPICPPPLPRSSGLYLAVQRTHELQVDSTIGATISIDVSASAALWVAGPAEGRQGRISQQLQNHWRTSKLHSC
jgi:hypothetical protein